MRQFKLAVLTTVAVVGFASIAYADGEDRARRAAPAPVAAVSDWSGLYVGGSLGARWSDPTWTTTCIGVGGAIGCPLNGLLPAENTNNPRDFRSSAVRFGLYAGYNWQIQNVVLGLEGDWGTADNRTRLLGIPGAELIGVVPGAPGADVSQVSNTWDASARGRIGYLVTPAWLLYASGGVAWTHVEASGDCGTAFPIGWCAGGLTHSAFSKNQAGWTLGGGLEWKFAPHWIARAEYMYADYGTVSGILWANQALAGDAINASVKLHTNTATVGVAYKF